MQSRIANGWKSCQLSAISFQLFGCLRRPSGNSRRAEGWSSRFILGAMSRFSSGLDIRPAGCGLPIRSAPPRPAAWISGPLDAGSRSGRHLRAQWFQASRHVRERARMVRRLVRPWILCGLARRQSARAAHGHTARFAWRRVAASDQNCPLRRPQQHPTRILLCGLRLPGGRKPSQIVANLIPHSPERREPLLLIPLDSGRIVEAVMQPIRMSGIDRTALAGVVADGQHIVEALAGKLVHRFRAVARNIDPQLPQNRDGFRPDSTGPRAGAFHFEAITPSIAQMAQQSLGHLAAGGIAGTKNEHAGLHALPAKGAGNQWRVRLHAAQTESITGTSTSTPTTVASAAPDSGPKSAIAVATASSKKLEAPISAPGAATECSTLNSFMRP